MEIRVRCFNNDPTKLSFFLRKHVITLSGTSDLIKNCFSTLNGLYFSSQKCREIKINEPTALGMVISSEESEYNYCSHVFSVTVLQSLCKSCFSPEVIENYLRVCSCIFKLGFEKSSDTETDSCTTTSCSSVELPSNSIWTISMLSEIFGTTRVTIDCKKKLAELLVRALADQLSINHILPEGLTLQEIKLLEQRLVTHFLRFGPSICTVNQPQPLLETPNSHIAKKMQSDKHSINIHKFYKPTKQLSQRVETPLSSLEGHSTLSSGINSQQEIDDNRSFDSWETENVSPVKHLSPASSMQSKQLIQENFEYSLPERTIETPKNASPSIVEVDANWKPRLLPSSPRIQTPSADSQLNIETTVRHTSPKATREELILSRNLALLRIKEARIKKDLEDSKIEAAKMLSQSKLKMLELKTAALRTLAEKKPKPPPASRSTTPRKVRQHSNPPEDIENYLEKTEKATAAVRARIARRNTPTASVRREQTTQSLSRNITTTKVSSSIMTPDKLKVTSQNSPKEISPVTFSDETHFIESGIYTQDALRAVGLGFSPNFVKFSQNNLLQQGSKLQNHTPFANHSTDRTHKTSHKLSPLTAEIVVVRAWDLIEHLGGTNAYVVLRVTSTQSLLQSPVVYDTVSPFFGTVFKFQIVSDDSSLAHDGSLEESVIEQKLSIVVMNKNLSLSNEVIGLAETSLHFQLHQNDYESMILNLVSTSGEHAGNIEIQARLLL